MPKRNHRLFEVGTFLSAHQNQFSKSKSHLLGGTNSKHGAIFMHKQPHLLLQGSKLGKARQLETTPVIKSIKGKFRVASPGEHIPGIQSGKLPNRSVSLIENDRAHLTGSSHNSSHLNRVDDPFPVPKN